MKRKLLGLMVPALATLPGIVLAEEGSVKIGGEFYPTLKEAVEAVEVCTEAPCETTTINVLENSETSGIVFESGKHMVIDFGGYTVTFKEPTVGSAGTETIDMQILKDSEIVLKNGTLVSSDTEKSKMFIQNYADLTLKDINIVATNELNQYALSNNSGTVSIEGTTSIKAKAVAFDVYGWYTYYKNGPQVTVDTTGTIEGKIEVAADKATPTKNLSLVIKNINHVGEISIQEGLEEYVTIENGSYTDETVTEMITPSEDAEVYEVVGNADGTVKYVVATEDELKETYFEVTIPEDAKEEYAKEVVKQIEELDKKLTEKYTLASYHEIFYGNVIEDALVIDSIQNELKQSVKVTINIPTALEKVKDGYTRKYTVIRLHESETEKEDGSIEYTYEVAELKATDNGDGTVTFETDKFSTYVLAYEDVQNTANPDTSDGIMKHFIMGTISLLSMIGLSIHAIRSRF